jgi:hypothetical protein
MWPLVLAVAVGQGPGPPPAPSWFGGRVYTSSGVHVGLRPALLASSQGPEWAAGATVQVSLKSLP